MKQIIWKSILFITLSVMPIFAKAQLFAGKSGLTLADTLRGSITPERAWWDALHYDLAVKFDIDGKKISGTNRITFQVLKEDSIMQIDLMEPMQITKITMDGIAVSFARNGAVHYLHIPKKMEVGAVETLEIDFNGSPRIAKNAPWDGGIVYKTDINGKPFVSVACQGLGASVWYPNKDHQADEPDSVRMRITIPGDLVAVSNGTFEARVKNPDNTVTYIWKVVNPINNYNFVPYIGDYARYEEVYQGEKGPLHVEMWFLKHNMEEAKKHVLPEIRRTIEAFEFWFGPFPFY
ncbi:MAG: M1 family peptidase, partial [Chitinophagales bacterium]